MKKSNKKISNGLIVMGKGERIGVICLLSLITVLLAFSVFRPAIDFSKKKEQAFHNLDSMIAMQERAAAIETAKKTAEMKGEAKNEVKTEAKKTGVKDRPNNQTAQAEVREFSPKAKTIPVLDINVADSLALVALPQIGQVMASRIHRYRNRLGGFVSFEQLFEVKGMDSARYATIKPYIVLENNEIQKLDVNRDEFKTLLRHPYLEYDQVKAIVNYRERKGLIKNWNQLRDIVGEVNPMLERYVAF